MKSSLLATMFVTALTLITPAAARADDIGIGGGSRSYPGQGGGPQCGDLRDWNFDQYLVGLLYEAVLFREASPTETGNWANQIARGGYNSLLQVAYDIGGSNEAQQDLYYRGSQAFLDNTYGVLFNRPVDQVGEYNWIPQLNAYRSGDVLRAIVGSAEFSSDYLR